MGANRVDACGSTAVSRSARTVPDHGRVENTAA